MLATVTSLLTLSSLIQSNEAWMESEQWSKSKQWSGMLAAFALFSCHLDAMLVVMPAFKLPWKLWEISEDVFKAKPGGGFHDPSPCFIGPDVETRPQRGTANIPSCVLRRKEGEVYTRSCFDALAKYAFLPPCSFVFCSALTKMLLSRF